MADPTRRQFLATTAAAAACACATCPLAAAAAEASSAGGAVDAGPLENFARDATYDRWAAQGFFIVRRGGRLYAVSSTCTHKKVRLVVGKGGGSFKCPRHGSLFDTSGHVTKAPARKPLPRYAVRVDDRGHVIVDRSARFGQADWDDAAASVDAARG